MNDNKENIINEKALKDVTGGTDHANGDMNGSTITVMPDNAAGLSVDSIASAGWALDRNIAKPKKLS